MSIRRVSLLLAAAIAAPVLVACTPRPDGPVRAVEGFFAAISEGDATKAGQMTDRPDAARDAVAANLDSLQVRSVEVDTASPTVRDDTAAVDTTFHWRLDGDREWTYSGTVQTARVDGDWKVRWTPTDLHPKLGERQSMALRVNPAPRARVNERSGSDVLIPGTVYRIRFDPSKARDVAGSASALVKLLSKQLPGMAPQTLVESATAAGGPYSLTTLSKEEYDAVSGALAAIPGVDVNDEAALVATDPNFAPEIVGQVRRNIVDQVDGAAGWTVTSVGENGKTVAVLTETAPKPVPSFSITLDKRIQDAAQAAVDARREQTMTVVMEASTGNVLAVAQNREADRDGSVATTGLYPPGSTFKIITASAAMDSGLAQPDTTVPCPGEIVIGQRSVPNYNRFSLGNVPMSRAFAASCNTSFAKLASEMAPDALTVAASKLGIGLDFDLTALPTATGSVPPADDLIQRTEDGFGQGKVLVSPFGMALAAATVGAGTTPVPHLLVGTDTTAPDDEPTIRPDVLDGLRQMMRQVVTSGTATRIADQGAVFGKTGEAEVEGGSHAWFVGYRGNLAFATLVALGGSSDNAVAVTREMLQAVPPEYG